MADFSYLSTGTLNEKPAFKGSALPELVLPSYLGLAGPPPAENVTFMIKSSIVEKHDNSAALAYEELGDQQTVLDLSITLEKSFASQADLNKYVMSHKGKLELSGYEMIDVSKPRGTEPYEIVFKLPPAVRAAIEDHWKRLLSSGEVDIALSGTSQVMIMSSVVASVYDDPDQNSFDLMLQTQGKPRVDVLHIIED